MKAKVSQSMPPSMSLPLELWKTSELCDAFFGIAP